jgi:phage terminase small subunit
MSRGRISAAALDVTTIHAVHRPEPPERLHEDAKEIWRQAVGRLPPDWFPAETLPMLEMYCIHVVLHRRLGEMALKKGISNEDVRSIMKQLAEEANLISHLATKMRLTQQSTHDRKKSKGKVKDNIPIGDDEGREGHPLD